MYVFQVDSTGLIIWLSWIDDNLIIGPKELVLKEKE